MKTFGDRIQSINFKKTFIAFFACMLAFVVAAVSYLTFVYQNQWGAAAEFENISSDIASGARTVQDVKDQLAQIASSFPGIIDVIVLDETGQVTYSANNSRFAQDGALESGKAQIAPEIGRGFPRDRMPLGDRDKGGRFQERDDFDFNGRRAAAGQFSQRDGYIVRSVIDNATGEQVLFISNPRALWNGRVSIPIRVIGIIGWLFFIAFKLLLCLWVYADSKKHGKSTILWTVLTLLTGLIGWIVYLIARGNTQKCIKCGAGQSVANQYCVKCGNCLKTMCANCNTVASGGDAYCKKCGAAVRKEDSSDSQDNRE